MSQQEFIPVYLVTGFLESGKTTMVQSMLRDPGFSSGQKTLILCCEEGETEYDHELLNEHNSKLVSFDGPEEFTAKALKDLNEQYKPERVIIEYNSFWTISLLGSIQLPRLWEFVQVITVVDATSFDNLMTNMRQVMTDPVKEADLILFNRCVPGTSKSPWRRMMRAVNRSCTILFENTDGTSEDGVDDEDLPYDMKASVIDISEDQFGIFYLDSMEHPDRYERKTVRLVGQACQESGMPRGYYYFCRSAMTCCANDIQKVGWVTQGVQKTDPKKYIELTAIGSVVESNGQKVLMLKELRTKPADKPRSEYATFN